MNWTMERRKCACWIIDDGRNVALSCPLCNQQAQTKEIDVAGRGRTYPGVHQGPWIGFDCPRCGRFMLTKRDLDRLVADTNISTSVYRLSSLLRERTIRKLPITWVQLEEQPYSTGEAAYVPVQPEDCSPMRLSELMSHWPSSVIDRIHRALCNLAHISESAGADVGEIDSSLVFAQDQTERTYHISALVELNYLRTESLSRRTITPTGWEKFYQLERLRSSPRNPAFVAMWFGSTKGTPSDWKPPRTPGSGKDCHVGISAT